MTVGRVLNYGDSTCAVFLSRRVRHTTTLTLIPKMDMNEPLASIRPAFRTHRNDAACVERMRKYVRLNFVQKVHASLCAFLQILAVLFNNFVEMMKVVSVGKYSNGRVRST
jgi:hypothetical protein